ncbi:uncharacterized protein BT62DRAFT_1013423 [Guyanagaster necrorhizus]|uniref:Uncharacterized protein n=1 Tax=Guyanagaster necrorhizus TaxID=856835 RepID=A0A9P7VGZ8_9AGAR|nr:uncharacterized protein BT62DRAFT_1013423 [Guyanagaster necrorhizus MCA 3950]KAG7439799.1 hypothetical protein BT62DRAFT_1013423 [Guyanagaster necrorhizus MCA 3950]
MNLRVGTSRDAPFSSTSPCAASDAKISGSLPGFGSDAFNRVPLFYVSTDSFYRVYFIKSTEDADKEPYSVFCSLPSYIGFRRCFPNVKRINLEISPRASTSTAVYVPVDWSIIVDDLPDGEVVGLIALRKSWVPIITFDVVQCGRNLEGYGLKHEPTPP